MGDQLGISFLCSHDGQRDERYTVCQRVCLLGCHGQCDSLALFPSFLEQFCLEHSRSGQHDRACCFSSDQHHRLGMDFIDLLLPHCVRHSALLVLHLEKQRGARNGHVLATPLNSPVLLVPPRNKSIPLFLH